MAKMAYRLGLDVGTNSLGWSVLKLGQKGNPCSVETAGSRIFSDGRDVQSNATLAADRREARSARRRRDRFKQRQAFLLDELTKAGLFPQESDDRNALQTLHPLALRAKALKGKLPPHHIGRALFHLNQRRGFQSNRKDRSEEKTSGKVSSSVRRLLEQMGLIDPPIDSEHDKALSKEDKKAARQQEAENRKKALALLKDKPMLTFGSFLWERYRQGEQTRARPGAGDDGKLYDVYPQRELYEDEFNKIWAAQAKEHPQTMTDATRKRIHHVIFTQRPLKPQKRGKCAYLPEEDRTYRAMPSFQRYRMYQEVNNLEWTTSQGSRKLVDFRRARDSVIDLLETPKTKNGHVVFSKMKKILKQAGAAEGNFTFNFETPKRKGLDGNQTSNLMRDEDRVGEQWDLWPLEKQDSFIMAIFEQVPDEKSKDEMREQTDDEVCSRLMKDFGLSEFAARNCLEAPLQEGVASVSLKAAGLLLEKMMHGTMIQSDAVQKVANENPDFVNPFTRAREGELLPRLPYYGEAFQDGRHIIPGDRKPEDKHDARKFYGGVTNPTVHIALNQIRQVVNELIQRFGHPHSIAIELGRELPQGKNYRSGYDKAQAENQERNRKWDDELRKKEQKITPDNRLRLQLWEEQGKCCPYSGEDIKRSELFQNTIHIDHILPFSKTLDDSRANKVVCTQKSNADKGNKTPWEAFHSGYQDQSQSWDQIFERAKRIKYQLKQYNAKARNPDGSRGKWETDEKSKLWRFQENALEIWKRDHPDFTARHLNDTRHIGRLTREYLECICPTDNIDVLTGQVTSLLRGHWGLNSILQHKADDGPKKKNRDDHRHHAVDAIVIGMTSRSMLQKVSTAANRAENLDLTHLFEKFANGKSPIDPWNGFRDEVADVVRDITVSHKAKRKKPRYETYVKDENGNIRKDEKGRPIRTSTEKRDEAILDKKGRPKKITTDSQLHNETAYGMISGPDQNGLYEVVARKPVNTLKELKHVESIRNPHLRKAFKDAHHAATAIGKKGEEGIMELAKKKRIRRLRCTETLSVIPIKDQSGENYKAYKGDSNWGMEIYAFPEGHNKADKWEGAVVSRFDANQAGFKPGETFKPHPAARLVMRLQINDCVEIEENGAKRIMRLQLMSQNGRLAFALHNEANVDDRNRDKADQFKYLYKSANALKSLKARKVHISPTGLVNYEKRRKPRRKK